MSERQPEDLRDDEGYKGGGYDAEGTSGGRSREPRGDGERVTDGEPGSKGGGYEAGPQGDERVEDLTDEADDAGPAGGGYEAGGIHDAQVQGPGVTTDPHRDGL